MSSRERKQDRRRPRSRAWRLLEGLTLDHRSTSVFIMLGHAHGLGEAGYGPLAIHSLGHREKALQNTNPFLSFLFFQPTWCYQLLINSKLFQLAVKALNIQVLTIQPHLPLLKQHTQHTFLMDSKPFHSPCIFVNVPFHLPVEFPSAHPNSGTCASLEPLLKLQREGGFSTLPKHSSFLSTIVDCSQFSNCFYDLRSPWH